MRVVARDLTNKVCRKRDLHIDECYQIYGTTLRNMTNLTYRPYSRKTFIRFSTYILVSRNHELQIIHFIRLVQDFIFKVEKQLYRFFTNSLEFHSQTLISELSIQTKNVQFYFYTYVQDINWIFLVSKVILLLLKLFIC